MMQKENPFKPSLQISCKEGIAASVMITITDFYLVPFGLVLGASVAQIGYLVAIPQFLGSITQLVANRLVIMLGSRIKFLIRGTWLQAFILACLSILPFWQSEARVAAFIGLIALFRITGNLVGTVWGSVISDYLSPEERGSYLGWRARITGLAGLAGLFAGGLLLALCVRFSEEIGFFLIFLMAVVARSLSAWLMSKMQDVEFHHKPKDHFTFLQFISKFRESNFMKFTLYVATFTFATNLAAPYFSVHMLENLKLNYFSFMLIHLAAVTAGLVSFPLWGKHADRYGTAQVLKITSLTIPLIPILWIFTQNFYLLILIEVISGFLWSGFNLCATNFVFDAVSPSKRVRCLGYFNLINGVAICLGALLGGFLVRFLPELMGWRLCSLFALSGLVRFLAHFLLSGNFKEVRETGAKTSSLNLFFSVVGIKPLLGRTREINVFIPGNGRKP